MPVADGQFGQSLVRLTRGADGRDRMEGLQPVRFVPLIGAEGWSETERSPVDDVEVHGAPAGDGVNDAVLTENLIRAGMSSEIS